MPLFVNTNVSSLNAQRQLMQSGQELDKASTRLASGRRINTAADDAAGLAISNRQTSTIRGLDQAIRNANDGISLIQTAEGALGESTNILQRMRELSIQSANGIYEDKDRATLDAEVQQLIQELDRIAESTSFNGQKILNGSLKNVDLQVGAQAKQTISFGIQAVDAKTLGMQSVSADLVGGEILDNGYWMGTGTTLALEEQDILINGQSVGAVSSTDTLNEIAAQITKNINGVTASTAVQIDASAVGTGVIGSAGIQFAVVGGDGLTTTYNVANTESLAELATAITASTGGIVTASVGNDGSLQVSAKDVHSISVIDADGGSGILAANVYGARFVLESDNGDPITIERGQTGELIDLTRYGFTEMREPGVVNGIANKYFEAEKLIVGGLVINGVQISASDTSSMTGKVDAINAVTEQTGVVAGFFTDVEINMSGFLASAAATYDQIKINGIDVDLNLANDATIREVANAFNDNSAATGVTARVLGESLVLESNLQRLISLGLNTSGTNFLGSGSGVTQLFETHSDQPGLPTDNRIHRDFFTVDSGAATDYSIEGGFQLRSINRSAISIEFGGSESDKIRTRAIMGFRETNSLGDGAFGSAISSISVDTQANAQKAISVIDNALETVNDIRSDLGAASNRLSFTISNLGNVSENTSAARSRIVDADFAAETASLSRAQVLQQASQAMLSQANARPQQVLSLLQ